jgi:bacteriocin biosynthesis cyclodehydratase domain-containing protein
MLRPGHRLIERAGVLHIYDGRRLVSLQVDSPVKEAILALAKPAEAGQGPEILPDMVTPEVLAASTALDAEALQQLIDLLVRLSLIDNDDAARGPDTASAANPRSLGAAFVSAVSFDRHTPHLIADRLAARSVWVVNAGGGELLRTLLAAGLRARSVSMSDLEQSVDGTSIVVADAADFGSMLDLLGVNELSLRHNFSWLPISTFDGDVLRVGPLVIPGQTACFDCALTRLASNVEFGALYRDVVAPAPAAATSAALRAWASAIAALTLLSWIGTADDTIPGTIRTLSPADLTMRSATVYRVPRCSSCGAADFLPLAAPWEPDGQSLT